MPKNRVPTLNEADNRNMKHNTINAQLLIALLGCATVITGCNTIQDSNGTNIQKFDWAKQLEEQVGSIPKLETQHRPRLATPTADLYTNNTWPLGNPQNLTQPIDSSTVRNNSKTASRPNTEGGELGKQSPVIVNVTQSANTTSSAEEYQFESSVQQESRLENLYSGKFEREANRDLEQFGYSFFETTRYGEQSVGPVPGNYILGPGDEIIVSLSGGVEAYHRIQIDRDGYLSVPGFGSVPLASQSYDSLYESLKTFFENRRRGFELTVSLGKLRQIQVNVVGRVENPGIVEVPAFATPLIAIAKAGGPKKDGTLRNIVLRRANSETSSNDIVDLYQTLQGSAEGTSLELLQDGDTLHVPAIGSTIGIAGYVQQPGIYELKEQDVTVEEAIDLAGGLTPFSFTPLARLERTIDGRGRQTVDLELNQEGLNTQMGDGELLMVEAVDDTRQPIVRIEGEVARPGEFQHRPGMKLSELIQNADGLTINAYLPQVIISRQLGQTDSFDNVTDRTSHLQTRRVIVVDLGRAIANDPKHDIDLMPLDLVTVRSHHTAQKRPEVEIIGSVQRPGKYELTAGMRVSDLVAIARNPNPDAFYDQAELIRRVFVEEIRRLDVKRFRFDLRQALDPFNAYSDTHNPILSNGDRLVVRSLQQAQVRVRIDGHVQFPGEYIFPSGAKITDLISAAGGILEEADMRAAVFSRVSTRQLQEEKMAHLTERTRRLYETAFERMVQTGSSAEGVASKLALQQTQDTLERMKRYEADGRIIVPFETPEFPNSHFNLALENGDHLNIPKMHHTISVAGHVFRPLSLIVGQPITVAEALQQAGGMTEVADADLLYVIRADGSVDSVAQKPARLKRKTELIAGDVLLVPRKPIERTFGAQLGEVLYLARQAAETALVTSRIGTDIDMTLVSPGVREQMGANADVLLDDLK